MLFSKVMNALNGIGDGTTLNMPLASDIGFLKGFGTPTYTRASTQYVEDFDCILRPVYPNTPPMVGSRIVTNYFYNSSCSGATASVSGTGTIPSGWRSISDSCSTR
jgi:hypothetical protein